QSRHVMDQLRVCYHPCATIRNDTHPIDRYVGLLQNEPRHSHTNNTSIKPVQDRVHRPIRLSVLLQNPTVEEHQLDCVEANRQVKKLILLAWCAAIIADHNNLSELLQLLTRLPPRTRKCRLVLSQFLS